jgi:ATP-dependent DNA helicase HFM1/MER3
VPPHVFPTSRTTETSNARPGKPVSKRTASKSKSGSKRRAPETEFDEFYDARIDDADLTLAENGGFENIDDFDEELGPKVSTSKKKQRTSNVCDDEATAQEPRQLANGKWACNHNCKDKTSCKHLCCREGLDKKPKPSKAKTTKKEAESPVDPRQTQLSMSVSKRAKT